MKSTRYINELLGRHVTDCVTGFEGVVTSVCFDLFGCIQAIVTPEVSTEGKKDEGYWFDVNRLIVATSGVVMSVPDFDAPIRLAKGQRTSRQCKGPI